MVRLGQITSIPRFRFLMQRLFCFECFMTLSPCPAAAAVQLVSRCGASEPAAAPVEAVGCAPGASTRFTTDRARPRATGRCTACLRHGCATSRA